MRNFTLDQLPKNLDRKDKTLLGRHVTKHKALDEELEMLNKRKFLTPNEEVRKKELQKRKLAHKDLIQAIITGNA